MSQNEEYAFVIPALNPSKRLVTVVNSLSKVPSCRVFVVDDGSDADSKEIFNSLNNDAIILRHAVNLGKGAALKTAFNYILVNYEKIRGAVTLDADGQHSPEDCISILNILKNQKDKQDKCLVLGYRSFKKNIPLKSYLGNNVSRFIYRLVLGRKLQDTQTGLRGLSSEFMKDCLLLKSNHFEFETEQLMLAVDPRSKTNIYEIPIKTIYFNNNKSSTFHPIKDSFKIYFLLFRYSLASLATFIFDILIFMIAINIGLGITVSNLTSRTFATFLQFSLLNNCVFKSALSIKYFLLFYLYVIISGLISSTLQISLQSISSLNPGESKVIVESLMFFVNFSFLRVYIFTNKAR